MCMSSDRFVEKSNGIWVRSRSLFFDNRGFFSEIFRKYDFRDLEFEINQCSVSFSKKDVVRGLHSQTSQWQLITLVKGEVTEFVFDPRIVGSGKNRKHVFNLQDTQLNQVLLAPGMFHGFHVTSEEAYIVYHTSTVYERELEERINLVSVFKDLYSFPPDIVMSQLDLDVQNS